MTNKETISKEIHLRKRPTGIVTEDDFEFADVKVPGIIKEGEFLVRNIWMSIDPFMRIYMVKGSKIRPSIELNKAIDGGCIGQIIESKSNKFRVGDYVKANFGWREYWVAIDGEMILRILQKSIQKLRQYNTSWEFLALLELLLMWGFLK